MAFAGILQGVLGAVGGGIAGEGAANAAEYNSKINLENADVVRQNTVAQAKQQARENYLRLGEMRAAIGKSGGTGGSFLDVLGDTAAQNELTKQNIIYAGSVKATNLTRGGLLDMSAAPTERLAGYLGAGSALIKGGASTYGSLNRA